MKTGFWAGFGKAAGMDDVSKGELVSELKKHEERETPAQEKAESAKEQEIERRAGVEKGAGVLKGLVSGLLGVGDLTAETIARQGGKAVRRSIAPAAAATGTAALMKGKEKEKEGEKTAAELNAKARNSLPDSAFVFPKERKFPIHDEAHAKAALAYAHTASDPAKVRSTVHAKYPSLGEKTAGSAVGRIAQHLANAGKATGAHFDRNAERYLAAIGTGAAVSSARSRHESTTHLTKKAFFEGFSKAAAVFSIKHKDIAKATGKLRNLASTAKK